jgi:hypothetical protein
MTSGAQKEKIGWSLPWCSRRFQGVLGTEVDNARGSCSRCSEALALFGR